MTVNTASTLKRLEAFENRIKKAADLHVSINGTGMIIHGSDQNKIYIPSGTGHIAHLDNSFVRIIMGPYGSGKSTWAATEIVRRACAVPMWHAGRRRSRWGIVRNTSGELSSTTLATWLAWFEDLGDIRRRQKPIMTYEHTFNDGHGVVELELLFIALDRPEDVRKIKSLELTGCYINELSEVPKAALAHMKGRVNRYPSKAFCHEPYWSGIIADTNPPEDDHWIYKDFEMINGSETLKQIMPIICLLIITKCWQKDNLKNLLRFFVLGNMVLWVLVSAFILNSIRMFTRSILYLLSKVKNSLLVGILALLLLALLCNCRLEDRF